MTKFLFNLIILSLTFFSTQAQVIFDVGENIGTQDIAIDVKVYNYNSIISQQFAIQWDSEVASLASTGNFGLPGLSAVAFNETEPGTLRHSWIDPQISGVTIPDGTIIFTLYFNASSSGYSSVDIVPIPPGFPIEVNSTMGEEPFEMIPGSINGSGGGNVNGKLFYDQDNDCINSGDPNIDALLSGWIITLTNETDTYYTISQNDGTYYFYAVPGDYTMQINLPNGLWTNCQESYPITIAEEGQSISQDLLVQAIASCPVMSVDIGTAFLRRCFDNTYTVTYCNQGTIEASDVYIEVTLDEFLSIQNATIPYTQNGNIVSFDIGSVPIGQCSAFNFVVLLDCEETIIGQTHCVTAHILPDDPCVPDDPSWSGASIQINGDCIGDELIFNIENVGENDMSESSQYIVIEDNIMYMENPFILNSGESIPVPITANGSTFRLEATQVSNHPGNSMPTLSIEGCGTDEDGNFSIGFVNQFSQNDGNDFVVRHCEESIGSYDPNDKQGFPLGFGDENGIKANTDIDYKIRFQNTGTDTAFNIVIRDQILDNLDPATVRPGASSHPYEFEIYEQGELIFTFENIMLPDSNVNEQASHGFVNFKISQYPDLPAGKVLNNEAAIYFDFNDPIITNKTVHTIVEDYLSVNTFVAEDKNVSLKTYPNPFKEYCVFELEGMETETLTFYLYDSNGRIMQHATFENGRYTFNKAGLATGNYFYSILKGDERIAAGKLLAQ